MDTSDSAYYGSKYHLLNYLDCNKQNLSSNLNALLDCNNVQIEEPLKCIPEGSYRPQEVSYESFIKDPFTNQNFGLTGSTINHLMSDWWCSKGKRPTWDLLCNIKINKNPAVLMVEAKAHKTESDGYKKISNPLTDAKNKNHQEILSNISSAFDSLRCEAQCKNAKEEDRNSGDYKYYQIANRIAYAWWSIHVLKIPVALVFLGFLGDVHFSDYITDASSWESTMQKKLNELGADKLIIGPDDEWSEDRFILIRSLPVNAK